jgi:hypothetical protein
MGAGTVALGETDQDEGSLSTCPGGVLRLFLLRCISSCNSLDQTRHQGKRGSGGDTRNQLNKLKFKYPDIDGHIAKFEDLIVKANYNLGSQKVINLFLKGFSHNRSLLDKVFTPPVPGTYKAMKKHMVAIVKSMQLVNSIMQNAPDFCPFQQNNQL